MADDAAIPSDTVERLEKAEDLKIACKHQEALAILEELLSEDPENISALEEIADNELSLARFDRAEAAARQAVTLDAGSYTGHYILGFLRSRDERWANAIEHLRRANSLKSNNPEILRCLGWALFMQGERPQGIVTLERALNLDADNVLILCDLGMEYLQVRNVVKAKALFTRALEIEPTNHRARECLEAVTRFETLLQEGRAKVA